jgi:hypothetical protein
MEFTYTDSALRPFLTLSPPNRHQRRSQPPISWFPYKDFQCTFHKAIIHLSTGTHSNPGCSNYRRLLLSHYSQLFNIHSALHSSSSKYSYASSDFRRLLASSSKQIDYVPRSIRILYNDQGTHPSRYAYGVY